MRNNLKNIGKIFHELNYVLERGQRKKVILIVLIMIVNSFLELLGVTAILPFIQSILNPDDLFSNIFLRPVIDFFDVTTAKQLMLLMGVGIMILYIFKNLYMLLSYYIQYDFATKVQKNLSVRMLQAYLKRPYTFFLETNTAEISRGCATDTSNVYNILSYLFSAFTELFTIVLIGTFIVYTDFFTAFGILIVMFVAMFVMVVAFKPMAKKAGLANREADSAKYKAISQTVSGIKEIYVKQRKNVFVETYEKACDISRKAQRTNSFIGSAPDRIIEGICVSGLVGIVCIRLFMDMDMADFVPKLAMFAMAAFKVLPSIGKITSRINGIVFSRPSLSNVYRIIKEADDYESNFNQYTVKEVKKENNFSIHFSDTLTISNVFWKYDKQTNPVLTGASLKIHKGEAVGFIGVSGAGKTTLADIILGLLHPQSGTVQMDGHDIYGMPEIWAQIVGYVPQSVYLLDDTIKNNIIFGMKQKTDESAKLWEVLEKAQMKEFVESLPQGLDTIVGERGVKFSGGQRQRIAIARALYSDPEILVMDEATAALDNETERAVMEAIEALQGQITMIIVAHRLTTIQTCDRIYEVKSGEVVMRSKDEIFGEYVKKDE